MKQELKGFQKIFRFTLARQVKSKSYMGITIGAALLCLILPALLIVMFGGEGEEGASVEEYGSVYEDGEDAVSDYLQIDTVYVADETPGEEIDFSFLSLAGDSRYEDIRFVWCGADFDSAREQASEEDRALVLRISRTGTGYKMLALALEDSELTEDDAWEFVWDLEQYSQTILIQKSGLDYRKTSELSMPVYYQSISASEAAQREEIEEDSFIDENGEIDFSALSSYLEDFKDILRWVIGYLVIFLVYMMVLLYGQGVANSVLLEKSSKLMDTFLVSVRPAALIFGKVTAIVVVSFGQMLLWAVCLVSSFIIGANILQYLDPDTTSIVVVLFTSLKGFGSLFSLSGAILALLVVLFGFVLYVTLAAICGALVDKTEDLSSSISLFTMIVVISFIATMFGGVMSSEVPLWMNLVPFTATMSLPGSLILGDCSLWVGLASLGIMLVCILLLMILAGRIYKMMVFYRGKMPKIGEIVKMIASGR